MPDEDGVVSLPLLWVDSEALLTVSASQILTQVDSDGIVITVGQVVRPVLLGSAEEIAEQARRLAYVPIRSLGRYSLSRDRLAEFVEVMKQALDNYDRQFGRGQ